ncbi:hypothetical protein L9F63_019999, partial [Diploptera punctata]
LRISDSQLKIVMQGSSLLFHLSIDHILRQLISSTTSKEHDYILMLQYLTLMKLLFDTPDCMIYSYQNTKGFMFSGEHGSSRSTSKFMGYLRNT